jgi:phage portal protein BeeE
MKFLSSLRTKAAVPQPAPSVSPAKAFVYKLFNVGVPRNAASYNNVVAAEKAMAHPVIYRCLNKLGLTVQGVKWYVADDPDALTTEVNNSKKTHREALSKALRRPNASMSGAQLLYWSTLSWALFGRVAYKVSVLADGRINGIYPLGIPNLKMKYNKWGEISEFTYGKGDQNNEVIKSLATARRGADGMPIENFAFIIIKPNINGALDLDKQNTALESIGMPKAVYDALMVRAYETAEGQPNSRWLVTADRDLDSDQADQVKEAIEDTKPGGDEAGNVLFIAGTNIKVTEMKNDLSDIHSKMPADDMARTMAGAWGIPIALLGFAGADGSKFANNYGESRRAFFEDTIEPEYLSAFEDGFTLALCATGYRVTFDRDSIPALREARATVAKIYSDVTFLTDEEKREATGWPKEKTGTVTNGETTGES